MIEWMSDYLQRIVSEFVVPTHTFSLVYIVSSILFAMLVWDQSNSIKQCLKNLFPKSIYTHRSSWMDVKIFIANYLVLVL